MPQTWAAFQAKRKATKEFNSFVRSPQIQKIWKEEKERETVAVARGTKWLSFGLAVTNFAIALHGSAPNLLMGLGNLVAAQLAFANQHSKLGKARGSTITRALMLGKRRPALAPPKGAVDRWLAAGLIRPGDLGSAFACDTPRTMIR